MYYRGVNLLPTIKETEVRKYSTWTKKLIMYLVWLVIIILVDIASYIPVSLEKIQLLSLTNKKKQIIADLTKDKEKYIKYHNIVFRLMIIENLHKSRFYLSKLVEVVDNTVYPSVANKYTIQKDGTVTIGLSTDSFTKASISWHKLLVNSDIFQNLNLSSFSKQQNEAVPFLLRGKINLNKIKAE